MFQSKNLMLDIEQQLTNIGTILKLKNKSVDGIWLRSSCPLSTWTHGHGADNMPSFGIVASDFGFGFHCFSCGHKGRDLDSLLYLLEQFTGSDYEEERERLTRIKYSIAFPDYETWSNTTVQREKLNPLPKEIYLTLYEDAWDIEESRNYLVGRGITEEACKKLELKFDRNENRILFPVFDSKGDLFGFSGRAISDKEKLRIKDYAGLPKKHMLLGEHFIDKTKPVLIVEGLFAYAHLFSIGADKLCNPIALMGASFSQEKVDKLKSKFLVMYLLLDNDMAGRLATYGDSCKNGLANLLAQETPTFVIQWPEGKDDPDQLSFDELQNLMKSAKLFFIKPLTKKYKNDINKSRSNYKKYEYKYNGY